MCLNGQKSNVLFNNILAIIDVTTAIVAIIILPVGALVINRTLHYRRRRRLATQTTGESTYYKDDINDNNINTDMSKAWGSSIRPHFPTIQNKLKIIAALATFIFIIIVLSESVVIVQAGHRGGCTLLRCCGK
jgi:hypothetical protein